MESTELPGNPPVTVALRRSARARRFSLRVSRLDGRVTLTVPVRARMGDALDFVRMQEGWIRRHLAAMPTCEMVSPGSVIPVEGRMLRVTPADVRVATIGGDALLIPGRGAPGPRVAGFLRALARDRLAQACDRHAADLGKRYTTLALRDTRSRWGSCSDGGRLMFSWRLVMAPPEILDYVAAHEVAHLVEMNHSPAFWAVVKRLCPDWMGHRTWLRAEGHRLHQYVFAST
ncbi:M48 family metallopeptidase [Halodurantibacterium flavum]|uniref:M48 family metallopeptidase n=1 Tax=Halodurantibacterium flavum TaxID=1382802 RepID=A0ABW4S3Z9_9RHOB